MVPFCKKVCFCSIRHCAEIGWILQKEVYFCRKMLISAESFRPKFLPNFCRNQPLSVEMNLFCRKACLLLLESSLSVSADTLSVSADTLSVDLCHKVIVLPHKKTLTFGFQCGTIFDSNLEKFYHQTNNYSLCLIPFPFLCLRAAIRQ